VAIEAIAAKADRHEAHPALKGNPRFFRKDDDRPAPLHFFHQFAIDGQGLRTTASQVLAESVSRAGMRLIAVGKAAAAGGAFPEGFQGKFGLAGALVSFDLAVAETDDAVSVSGDVRLMRDQDDGVALLMEAREERHDFFAGGGIKIAGGLIG